MALSADKMTRDELNEAKDELYSDVCLGLREAGWLRGVWTPIFRTKIAVFDIGIPKIHLRSNVHSCRQL